MADFRPFSPCWGDISFTEAPRTTARCYAGAIFLSRSPFGATARARGVAWPRCPRVAGPSRASGQRASHASVHQAPPVWRAPEGPEGLAAVPVGGGGAWPDNESTHRTTRQHTRPHWHGGCRRDRRGQAKLRADAPIQMLAARTARGRAAAHGHTKQPDPTTHHSAPGTPAAQHAT